METVVFMIKTDTFSINALFKERTGNREQESGNRMQRTGNREHERVNRNREQETENGK